MVNHLVKMFKYSILLFFSLTSASQVIAATRAAQPLATHKNNTCPSEYILCTKTADNEGEKIITIEQIEEKDSIYDNIEDEYFTYSYTKLYVKVFNNNILQSKTYDFHNTCYGNAGASYITNSLKITDLNNNGIKEITFLYNVFCENDTSPPRMKLIMVEGNNKYKIRGHKKSFVENWDIAGTNFNIDPSFSSAEKELLDFATEQWSNFVYSGDETLKKGKKNNIEKYNEEILKLKNEFMRRSK